MDPLARAFTPRKARPTPILTCNAEVKSTGCHSAIRSSPKALYGQEGSIWGAPNSIATRSATMPAKLPWSLSPFGSPTGLGLNFGGSPLTVNKRRSFTPTTPSPLRQTHPSPSTAIPLHKTYPLMQQEFGTPRQVADQPRTHTGSSSVAFSTGSTMKENDTAASEVRLLGPWPASPNQNDRTFAVSTLSPHYLETHPELANAPTPVFRQSNHPQGWKRLTNAPGVRVEEAFGGAHEIVRSLNPEYFSMPYGTRVVNIKTDYIENMHIAIRHGVWSTLDKVSRRIMVVWNARKYPQEKVLFLFAVNGSKNYCGLAEMSGSYDASSPVEGWQGPSCSGAIPLTWLYVKNVPYTNVHHITQLHNNQPVVNMWNGMKITSETARKVVEIYVKTPHFTNILAWLEGTGHHVNSRLRTQPSTNTLHNVRGSMSVSAGEELQPPVTGMSTHSWRTTSGLLAHKGHGNRQQEDNNMTPTQPARASHQSFPAVSASLDHLTAGSNTNIVNLPCVVNADGSVTLLSNHSSVPHHTVGRPDKSFDSSRQTSDSAASSARGPAGRHRGRGGLRSVMRGGTPQTYRLRAPRSIPTIRESDFDRFRNRIPDGHIPPQTQQGLGMMPNIQTMIHSSELASHQQLHHIRSTDTLVPGGRPKYIDSEQHLFTSVRPQPRSSQPGSKPHQEDYLDPFTATNSQAQHDRSEPSISESTYPGAMEEADSLAGYMPINRMVERRQARETSDIHPNHSRAIIPYLQTQSIEDWENRVPTGHSFPDEQTAAFYQPAVDDCTSNSDSGHSLRSVASVLSLRGQAEYYRILAEKAEHEANINERLARLGVDQSGTMRSRNLEFNSDSSSHARTRGSSDNDYSTVDTSSVEQTNILTGRKQANTNFRRDSRHEPSGRGFPISAGPDAPVASFHRTWDSSVQRVVDQVVTSPPSSDNSDNVRSPPPNRTVLSGDSIYATAGLSGGVNLRYP